MVEINYNERSFAIDLISEINSWASCRDVKIKKAGGETTLNDGGSTLFPDIILYSDTSRERIIQGWEMKMPDTDINDSDFIDNARKKAQLLKLNSFLLWNVTTARLYSIAEDGSVRILKEWVELADIKDRRQVKDDFPRIAEQLSIILSDVLLFLDNGTITTGLAIDAIDVVQIGEIINRNMGDYAESIELHYNSFPNKAHELDAWWYYAKNEYPEERNRFRALARNNIVALINKFLLAHILKNYNSKANEVDVLTEDSTVLDGIEVFNHITAGLDFWNIFRGTLFEDALPSSIWKDFVSLNAFLKDVGIGGIDRHELQGLVSRIVEKNKRKLSGQFTTPDRLAKLLIAVSVESVTDNMIDPTCGSGAIVKEIYDRKNKAISSEDALGTTWGSDKFATPLQMATFNMIEPELSGKIVQLFNKDAVDLRIGQRISFQHPLDGSVSEKVLPEMGLVAANLPFVKQGDIQGLNPDIEVINESIVSLTGRDELRLIGRTDLYGYLPFYLWNIIKVDGRLAVIVSNSWMGTEWGEIFFKAIRCFYDVERIITSSGPRWFKEAKVISTILVLRKKVIAPEGQGYIDFVTIKRDIYADNFTEDFIAEVAGVIDASAPVDDKSLAIVKYGMHEIELLSSMGVGLNSLFTDLHWLDGIKDKLVSASTHFSFSRGIRRGWDPMFFPRNGSGIEPEYLSPLLKTPRSISSIFAVSDSFAFCCTRSVDELRTLGHVGASSWIDSFANMTNEIGVPLPRALAVAGSHWYSLKLDSAVDMAMSVNYGDRLFVALFETPTFINQRLIGLTAKPDTDKLLCAALMNSSLGYLLIEVLGFGRGEGALDVNKNSVESMLRMINPLLYAEEERKIIIEAFQPLLRRDIESIEDELGREDRRRLDEAILKPLGLLSLLGQIKTSLLLTYGRRSV